MSPVEEGLVFLAQEHKRRRSAKTIKDLRAMIKIGLSNHMEISEISALTKMPYRFVQRIANERTR